MYLVCDVESSGLSPSNNSLLTGCFIKLDKDLVEQDRLILKFRPSKWGDSGNDASKIHGISEREANMFPPLEVGINRLLDWLDFPRTFVCHANFRSNHFDHAFILLAITECGADHFRWYQMNRKIISTHTLFKAMHGGKNNKLSDIAKHYDIKLKHHDAESDAEVCAEILRRLKKERGFKEFYEDF